MRLIRSEQLLTPTGVNHVIRIDTRDKMLKKKLLNDNCNSTNGPAHTIMVADIRSTDGKHHRVIFDRSKKVIKFTIMGGTEEKQRSMLKDLNELICVRGTPITMRRGLPFDLNKNAKQVDTPNHLYFYFAEKRTKRRWRIRTITALFTTTTDKKLWLDVLDSSLHELEERPKTLLILVNPFGGKGKAKKIYSEQVAKILEMAGIHCDVVMTERANHAFDYLKQLDFSQWTTIDGVVSVGGDGLFNECLSAIVCRTQEEAGKDISDVNIDVLKTPRMRFGIIGAGSANSIVSSVHGTDDCPTAAIHIALGSKCSVDVCTVHRDNDLMRISANAISYGWLGDVLADSERYRWMGPLRYQYSALRTTVRNPAYFGRVSFSLIPEAAEKNDLSILPKCTKPCSICESGVGADKNYPFHLQTEFSHIICCVVPCVSPFTPYGLAPFTGIGDGSMDLALIPRISRCSNLSFIRKVAMSGPKSVLSMGSKLNVFRVARWAFTPVSLLEHSDAANSPGATDAQGSWNLDGEILPQPKDAMFQFRLHPRLIKYFGREVDLNARAKKTGCCSRDYQKLSNIVRIQLSQDLSLPSNQRF
uniref:DAGKc domain-containing protein n=1 Tax=Setaria digitata TaxID=48799 RepID=A0A915PYJ5_9BILA